ncbi:hypothetical protein D9Q98_005662 [Chlorella vulgaris]|uniref:Exonuclease 1 n=1 Tax=Chlorella vulgaris TaxID=3077 RepID=A0A9D4TMK9_CHLVU|nr:hypothetical protein D9Q98_005662 [Chlorella vulgaris]
MGIAGLHPVLKPYCALVHVRELAGHRVGIDAWSWLHRGACGAAHVLASNDRPWEQRGFDAPYVEFCLKMCRLLTAANVTPVLVFDGCRLPAKAATNQQRRDRRAAAKERLRGLLQEGRQQEAYQLMVQCVDVTADMAQEVMVRCRERGVEFLVAPYEADGQLAYLSALPESDGGVAAVITEDSDLVAYGCRRVLFKMDSGGNCLDLRLDRLLSGSEAAVEGGGAGGSGGGPPVLSLRGWSLDMLQAACVLAGCDFLPSLKGISFKTAAGFVARRRSLEGALRALRLEKRFQLAATDEYCAAARKASLAFKHCLVFCANTSGGSCRRLTPLPTSSQQLQGRSGATAGSSGGSSGGVDLSHLGAELAPDVARSIAYGYLHPHTLQPFAAASHGSGRGDTQQNSQQPLSLQQQQQQQQQRPSIAGRCQLASWVGSGTAALPGRHGLGPQPSAPPPLSQALQNRQQAMHRGATDVSDLVQAYVQQPSAGSGEMRQQQHVERGSRPRALNPFARQQLPSEAGLAVAAALPAASGPPQEAQFGQQGGCAALSEKPAAGEGGGGELPQEEPLSSWEEAATDGPADVRGPATAADIWHQGQRPAMQSITNRASQQPLCDSQEQSCATTFCGSSSQPSTTGLKQEQQQQHAPVWDAREQYRRSTALTQLPATAAGTKRRSSGGGSGGTGKRAAVKPLAPPAQRISRFFEPKRV